MRASVFDTSYTVVQSDIMTEILQCDMEIIFVQSDKQQTQKSIKKNQSKPGFTIFNFFYIFTIWLTNSM